MSTYAIEFKEADSSKIQNLINFVRSLDFVASVEPSSVNDTLLSPKSIDNIATDSEYLPIVDLKILFPNQWVLLSNVKKDKTSIIGGKVICND
jgi:hypothetical protein